MTGCGERARGPRTQGSDLIIVSPIPARICTAHTGKQRSSNSTSERSSWRSLRPSTPSSRWGLGRVWHCARTSHALTFVHAGEPALIPAYDFSSSRLHASLKHIRGMIASRSLAFEMQRSAAVERILEKARKEVQGGQMRCPASPTACTALMFDSLLCSPFISWSSNSLPVRAQGHRQATLSFRHQGGPGSTCRRIRRKDGAT